MWLLCFSLFGLRDSCVAVSKFSNETEVVDADRLAFVLVRET